MIGWGGLLPKRQYFPNYLQERIRLPGDIVDISNPTISESVLFENDQAWDMAMLGEYLLGKGNSQCAKKAVQFVVVASRFVL